MISIVLVVKSQSKSIGVWMHSDPKWIHGLRVPALSESIVMSGLVPEKYIPKDAKPTPQMRQSQMAVPIPAKAQKIPLKLAYRSAPPERMKNLEPMEIEQFAVPRPNITLSYKPPPIEEISENRRSQMLTQTRLQTRNTSMSALGGLKDRDIRTEARNLTHELDTTIADVGIEMLNAHNVEQRVQLNAKLADVHNYVFNQLILLEKRDCSDRAILFRRIQQFLAEQLKEIPNLRNEFEDRVEALTLEIKDLKQKLTDEKRERNELEIKFKKENETLKQVKQDLHSKTEESNEKDIKIQADTFELEYVKGQLANLQYKFSQNRDKYKALKVAIKQRDEESRKQIEQIEQASDLLEQYKRQDTGYIPLYHEEKNKVAAAEKRIEELEQEINALRNVEKNDIAVDTSDLPRGKGKKQRMGSKQLTAARNSTAKFPEPPQNPKAMNRKLKGKMNSRSQIDNFINSENMSSDSESQSQISLSELASENISMDVVPSLPVLETGDYVTAETQTEPVKITKMEKEEEKYDLPSADLVGELIEEKDDNSIPNILPLIIPALARPFRNPSPTQDLTIFGVDCFDKIVKHKKPLLWGIQLIHNFLMDPYLRSDTFSIDTLEFVFYEWLSQQFKLGHLIKQVAADFTFFLYAYLEKDHFVKFFYEMLCGFYTRTQVIFISTVYSFTIHLTTPNFVEMMKQVDDQSGSSQFDSVDIHISAASAVISSAFSKEMANSYIHNRHGKDIISYVQFLKDMGDFFSEKHRLLYQQTKDLLSICGTLDSTRIYFEPFCQFLVFLGVKDHHKKEWGVIQLGYTKCTRDYITLGDLITFCASRRKPMMEILSMIPLTSAIANLKTMPDLSAEVFDDFRGRCVGRLQEVLDKVPREIAARVQPIVGQLRSAILRADLPQVLWFYRLVLTKLDRLLMAAHGSIPYPRTPTPQTVRQLTEYFDRTESVALAFIRL